MSELAGEGAQMSLVKLLFPNKNSQIQSNIGSAKVFCEYGESLAKVNFFWLRMAVSRRKNFGQPPYIYIYIYISNIHVGKYTSPRDPMGFLVCSHWQPPVAVLDFLELELGGIEKWMVPDYSGIRFVMVPYNMYCRSFCIRPPCRSFCIRPAIGNTMYFSMLYWILSCSYVYLVWVYFSISLFEKQTPSLFIPLNNPLRSWAACRSITTNKALGTATFQDGGGTGQVGPAGADRFREGLVYLPY